MAFQIALIIEFCSLKGMGKSINQTNSIDWGDLFSLKKRIKKSMY